MTSISQGVDFRSLQPELAHANEISRDIHLANTLF